MAEEVHIINKIDARAGIVSLRSDGIMQFEINKDVNVEVDDVKEMNDAAGKLGDEKKFPNLILIGELSTYDKETREYSATEEPCRYTLADALVINSLPHKILGNFYINFDKPMCPTKLFNNEEDAVKWLKTFLKKKH